MAIFESILITMLLGIPAMLLHECGHLLVAMLCGVKVKKVGLSKTGLYTVREPGPKWANLSISLAGPLVNLALAATLRETLPAFAWVNLIAFAYNLLPIPNSDGSRVLALLSQPRANVGTGEAHAANLGQSPVA